MGPLAVHDRIASSLLAVSWHQDSVVAQRRSNASRVTVDLLRSAVRGGQPCVQLSCKGPSGAVACNSAGGSSKNRVSVDGYRVKLEALLHYGKSVPEEKIEKPAGLPANPLPVGDKPQCGECLARGAVLCLTCAGSGLYVDSILESQGIIVRVRCLGCGGSGNIMCTKCGGRGHI